MQDNTLKGIYNRWYKPRGGGRFGIPFSPDKELHYNIFIDVEYVRILPYNKYRIQMPKIETLREKILNNFLPDISFIIRKYDFHLNCIVDAYIDHCSSLEHMIELPNGKIVGTDNNYYSIVFSETKHGNTECILMSHLSFVNFIGYYFKNNELRLVTASQDNIVKIWNTENYSLIKTLVLENEDIITAVVIQRINNQDNIVMLVNEHNIRLWNTVTEEYTNKTYLYDYDDEKTLIRFIDKERFLITSGDNIFFGDITKNDYTFHICIHTEFYYNNTIDILPNGLIISIYKDSKIAIIDSIEKKIIRTLKGNHPKFSYIEKIVLIENQIVSVSSKRSVEFWNCQTYEWIGGYTCGSDIKTICKLPNNTIALKLEEGIVIFENGKLIREIPEIKYGDEMLLLSDNRMIIHSGCDVGIFR